MTRKATLEIHKDEFSFSAGHFTIFSATEREPLHGHNYNVSVTFDILVGQYGLMFDYRYYKRKVEAICKELNWHMLLPGQSPYLRIEAAGEYWHAHFNQTIIPFLREDVIILPLTNITIEELSHWFLQRILENQAEFSVHAIHGITVKVFNGPGQAAGASWYTEALLPTQSNQLAIE